MMPSGKQVVMVRGFDPVLDDKYRTQDSDKYKYAISLGRYEYWKVHLSSYAGFNIPEYLTDGHMEHGYPRFSPEELFMLPDDAFTIPGYDGIPDAVLVSSLLPAIIRERQEDEDTALK